MDLKGKKKKGKPIGVEGKIKTAKLIRFEGKKKRKKKNDLPTIIGRGKFPGARARWSKGVG